MEGERKQEERKGLDSSEVAELILNMRWDD
jgi:hypothetical protein